MALRRRMFRNVACILLICAFLLSSFTSVTFRAAPKDTVKGIVGIGGDYTDNAYIARRLDVVFSEFPVGSYFSYTGKACTCHNKCSFYGGCDCISDYDDPEKDGALVRLYSCQCMGFAHYMFYKLFGFIDRTEYKESEGKYYSLGSLKPAQMTVANVKNLFKDAKTGANVRIPGAKKHSFIVLSTNEEGMYIYHANTGVPCKVDCWFWTWEKFVSIYAAYGIEYIHMPTEYPPSVGVYVPPVPNAGKIPHQIGQVRVDTESSNLNLRASADKSSAVLASIPHATLLTVTEVSGDWGKVEYDGKTGWVSLDYTKRVLSVAVPADRFYSYEGVAADMTEISVSLLQEDMTLSPIDPAEYSITYSSPEQGKYTAFVTYKEHTVSFLVQVLPFGDLDADLLVTAADASLLAQLVSNGKTLSHRQKEGADLDGNGAVDRADAVAMVAYLTGKTKELTPKKGDES